MYPCLKLKYLEGILGQIDGFERPKVGLEQYVTPSHLASHMLYMIQSQYDEITDKIIGDFGSGCGALTIGASTLKASYVIGFEVDQEAIDIALCNLDDLDVNTIDFINCDVRNISKRFSKFFDTIIMNPPFGTKNNQGMDVLFLEKAFEMAKSSVYSLHKTSTREFILKTAKLNGVKAEVLAELKYDLPATLKFHRKKTVDVEVDFIRFTMV
ncbi:rRNA N(6)-adenosine-methyltransferase METTL5 [Onthophagus taurus]|uniref:rRNA N(6)-adenosine-methyltransferase METTL5 n=1 Tax=Onthophagus taurus TaxID=166361 RepID=UPI000C2096CE|nr:methyltransferase-like protein 5 [Onthophagus taurus]